jgi:hypothetical protein
LDDDDDDEVDDASTFRRFAERPVVPTWSVELLMLVVVGGSKMNAACAMVSNWFWSFHISCCFI